MARGGRYRTIICPLCAAQKIRRVFVKAEGGTIEGLRRSLRERLELEDDEYTIAVDDGRPEGHFVAELDEVRGVTDWHGKVTSWIHAMSDICHPIYMEVSFHDMAYGMTD